MSLHARSFLAGLTRWPLTGERAGGEGSGGGSGGAAGLSAERTGCSIAKARYPPPLQPLAVLRCAACVLTAVVVRGEEGGERPRPASGPHNALGKTLVSRTQSLSAAACLSPASCAARARWRPWSWTEHTLHILAGSAGMRGAVTAAFLVLFWPLRRSVCTVCTVRVCARDADRHCGRGAWIRP